MTYGTSAVTGLARFHAFARLNAGELFTLMDKITLMTAFFAANPLFTIYFHCLSTSNGLKDMYFSIMRFFNQVFNSFSFDRSFI